MLKLLKKLYYKHQKRKKIGFRLKNEVFIHPSQVAEFNYIFRDTKLCEKGGLLFGKVTPSGFLIEYILPVMNESDNPNEQFEFKFSQYVPTILKLRGEGLNLIGEYHTHPSGKPNASNQDHITMQKKAESIADVYMFMVCTVTKDVNKGIFLQSYKVYSYI